MSDGSWRKKFDFGIVLAVCGLLIILPIAGLMLSEYAKIHRANAAYQQNAEKDRAAASEEISRSCFNSDFAIFSECITEKIATFYKQQATNQDLQAQQDMAYWAKALFFLGALQFILSSAGIYFIWRSLALNRDAVDVATKTNKFAQVEREPLIAIEDIKLTLANISNGSARLGMEVKWRNAGGSAAYGFLIEVKGFRPRSNGPHHLH